MDKGKTGKHTEQSLHNLEDYCMFKKMVDTKCRSQTQRIGTNADTNPAYGDQQILSKAHMKFLLLHSQTGIMEVLGSLASGRRGDIQQGHRRRSI